jgi:hypothetical protein
LEAFPQSLTDEPHLLKPLHDDTSEGTVMKKVRPSLFYFWLVPELDDP